jgi:hypothetical protein
MLSTYEEHLDDIAEHDFEYRDDGDGVLIYEIDSDSYTFKVFEDIWENVGAPSFTGKMFAEIFLLAIFDAFQSYPADAKSKIIVASPAGGELRVAAKQIGLHNNTEKNLSEGVMMCIDNIVKGTGLVQNKAKLEKFNKGAVNHRQGDW